MALKVTLVPLLGVVARTLNRSNAPGGMPPDVAIQLTSVTAVVKVPSSVVTGLGSGPVWVVNVHPGLSSTSTFRNGWSVGNCTSSRIVDAACSSLGTRNPNTTEAPRGSDDGSTSTWAHAGLAAASMPPITASALRTRQRRARRFMVPPLGPSIAGRILAQGDGGGAARRPIVRAGDGAVGTDCGRIGTSCPGRLSREPS